MDPGKPGTMARLDQGSIFVSRIPVPVQGALACQLHAVSKHSIPGSPLFCSPLLLVLCGLFSHQSTGRPTTIKFFPTIWSSHGRHPTSWYPTGSCPHNVIASPSHWGNGLPQSCTPRGHLGFRGCGPTRHDVAAPPIPQTVPDLSLDLLRPNGQFSAALHVSGCVSGHVGHAPSRYLGSD